MEKPITRTEARAFRERWRMVNEAEKAELRSMSINDKFAQLAALMASADMFEWPEEEIAREIAEVRRRWAILRRDYV